MMGKNKKPSECQITKNLRLYRCRVTRMRKAVWKESICCVGYIGKVGMHQTDKEIIKMMLK